MELAARAIKPLLVLIVLAAPLLAAAARADGKAVPPVTQLGVATAIDAFRKVNDLTSLKKGAVEAAELRAAAASSRTTGAPRLNLEGELSPQREAAGGDVDGKKSGSALTATLRIQQGLAFGVDRSRLATLHRTLAEAELLDKGAPLVDDEKDMVLTFIAARQELAIHTALGNALAEVKRLAAQAARAAQIGTLDALTATRAGLLLDELQTNVEQSHIAYGAHLASLTNALELALPNELGAVAFEALPDEFSATRPLDLETLPALHQLQLKKEALAAQRDDLRARREVELAAGVGRTFGAAAETSVVVEMTVPLGIAAAASSSSAALDAERAALDAESELARRRLVRADVKARSETERLLGAQNRTELRVQRLEGTLAKTSAAFHRGQAAISEVLEVLREVIDARVEAARQRGEYERALVERRYLFVTRN